MAVVFTVLMVMAGIYALFKWPIPTLVVLGVLIVIGKSGENKNGGTAPTTAPPSEKPKAPSSPIKPQAVQPTVQAQPKAPEVRKAYTAPSMKELLYPAEVPTFAELAEGKHKDPRALIYTIANLDPERKRPFAEDDISYLDFGRKSSAYSALKKAGLIEPLTPSEEIEKALTKDELLALVRERGLPDTGKKRALADRLAGSGYKLNRRKTGGHLFRLTETGAGIVTVRRNDKRAAINRAIAALKERNYQGAVEAYRKYDSKWGFAHTSGKVHTIFAYYDIPRGRFQCIENCAMQELHNTDDFKETLRACLLAGFMRGCQDRWELTDDFKAVCKEEINCPRLLSLFDYEPAVLQNMRQQIEFSSDNALEYYISHLLYMSKQRG